MYDDPAPSADDFSDCRGIECLSGCSSMAIQATDHHTSTVRMFLHCCFKQSFHPVDVLSGLIQLPLHRPRDPSRERERSRATVVKATALARLPSHHEPSQTQDAACRTTDGTACRHMPVAFRPHSARRLCCPSILASDRSIPPAHLLRQAVSRPPLTLPLHTAHLQTT